jgi:paired amphipathic helix protein Sin3a
MSSLSSSSSTSSTQNANNLINSSNGSAAAAAAASAAAASIPPVNNSSAAANSNQFYRLKVEDALSYLDQVKFQFERQPEVYNQFLDIMKEFKSQTIDTPGVISRVSNLFRGHTDLIEGFNTFLPPGYKIEVQANDSVHYTAPNSTRSTLVQPIFSSAAAAPVASLAATQKPTEKPAATNAAPLKQTANAQNVPLSVKMPSTAHTVASNLSFTAVSSSLAKQPTSSNPTSPNNPQNNSNSQNNNGHQAAQSQVEFGHAINYVNKIKSRFHNQPDIYKSFLEILHTYQKQQKNLKDGILSLNSTNNQNYLSETEVYGKVANLFKNQEDLLIEFSQFLPDATNSASASSSSSSSSSNSTTSVNTIANSSFSTYPTNSLQSQQLQQQPHGHQILINSADMPSYLSSNNLQQQHQQQQQQQQQQQHSIISAIPGGNVLATYNLTNLDPKATNSNMNHSQATILQPIQPIVPLIALSSVTSSNSHMPISTIEATLANHHHHHQNQHHQTTNTNEVATGKHQIVGLKPTESSSSSSSSSVVQALYSKTDKNYAENVIPQNLNATMGVAASPKPTHEVVSNQPQSRPLTPINQQQQQQQQRPNKRPTPFQQIAAKKLKSNTTIINQQHHTIVQPPPPQSQQQQHNIDSTKIKLSINQQQQGNNLSASMATRSHNSSSNNQNQQNYHEAPINETTFFEKLKKSLRTQQVYENFLKCLSLFNRDVVTRCELIALVEPFLGKFPNLFRWFKDYVENKPIKCLPSSSTSCSNPNSHHQTNPNAIFLNSNEQIPLIEIDYLSCKQYGASYRDISAYPTPTSSGQTESDKQVLNATYVSFPSWSEDSTFISSKKNQYEELIFRIDDERFELDNILETNQSTIKLLETLQVKLNKMSQEELLTFRLTNTLGGTSEVIHIKAIQRVYTDRAKDFIDGLKKNPSVAVPLVLKRLKAKDEEWREAKKNLEKQWKEQMERNYLKSLDHCAVPFKQNDQKHLKAKSLISEIETIYYERQEAKDEQTAALQALRATTTTTTTNTTHNQAETPPPNLNILLQHNRPHFSFKNEDKSILEDAAALIIHHVKRQTAIQKEDKQRIKQIMHHFLPDFFFVSRGALSDDESEKPDPPPPPPQTTTPLSNVTLQQQQQANSADGPEVAENSNAKKLRSTNITASLASSNAEITTTTTTSSPMNQADSTKRPITCNNTNLVASNCDDSNEDMYRLFYVDEHWYLFFRYHQILCERLSKIYKQAELTAEQENLETKSREQSVAEALKLRNKSEIPCDEYYTAFLDIVRNLLDGNMDSVMYEDTLREMFGIHAYHVFTLDKVVHNCVRQLQYLVQDDCSTSIKQIFLDEQNSLLVPVGSTLNIANLNITSSVVVLTTTLAEHSSGCGGKVSNMSYLSVMNSELAYQKKAEALLLNDQNCYKILSYKNSCRLTVELVDTQNDEDEDTSDAADKETSVEVVEKWSDYIEKEAAAAAVAAQSSSHPSEQPPWSDRLKEVLLKRPVFLTRNAHVLKQKYGNTNHRDNWKLFASCSSSRHTSTIVKSKVATTLELTLANAKLIDGEMMETTTSMKQTTTTTAQQPIRIKYDPNNTILVYRRNAFKNARKCHQAVTKTMYANFKKFSHKWLKDSSTSHESVDSWLLGQHIEPYVKTICTKESSIKKPPYHVYFRYKVTNQGQSTTSKNNS